MENENTTIEPTQTTEATEKKGIKAKTASLWGQIFASLWIIGWNSAQFIQNIVTGKHIDGNDIIFSGLSIAACFTPIYFNLLMDKVKDIKGR